MKACISINKEGRVCGKPAVYGCVLCFLHLFTCEQPKLHYLKTKTIDSVPDYRNISDYDKRLRAGFEMWEDNL